MVTYRVWVRLRVSSGYHFRVRVRLEIVSVALPMLHHLGGYFWGFIQDKDTGW